MVTDAKQFSSVLQRVSFFFQNQFNGINTQIDFEEARGSCFSIQSIDDVSFAAFKSNVASSREYNFKWHCVQNMKFEEKQFNIR